MSWLKLDEVAQELGVTTRCVRNWITEGKLTAYQTPGGSLRVKRIDLESAMKRVPTVKPRGWTPW